MHLIRLFVLMLTGYVLGTCPGDDLVCDYPLPNVPNMWAHMEPECLSAMTSLINTKMANSIQYLALGAYFSRDSINRMGFADLFYEHADSNREDAIELIDYVLMRGFYTDVMNILQLWYAPGATDWNSAKDAINAALELEGNTTQQFHQTITTCESLGVSDYNIANWLSRYFLREQYNDQRFFVGVSSALEKMLLQHEELGEWLMDVKIANDDINFI